MGKGHNTLAEMIQQLNQMQNGESVGVKAKSTAIPKYAEKYKNMLQQSSISQQKVSPKQQVSIPAVIKKQYFFYRIKTIGVGAHSFVYLVQEQSSKMIFAQKSVTLAHSKQVKEDLIRQIKILSLANHQNIVKLYHFYATETHINLAMEYAEDSLFALKQRFQVFKEKQILEVVRQLLNGLHYLHRMGIVHADVKLQNIMIANGTVKLCDFGYAHQHPQKQQQQEIVGTMEYLAPEYARGMDSGPKRDIWAIGILAFEMLVGKTPFEGLKQAEKWSKLIKSAGESFVGELQALQQQLGVRSQKIQGLLRHILCEQGERWSAQKLLKLPMLQVSV